ncbi:ribonuclease H-like domain-containing protein [Tanacetum coccineum]
MRSKLMHYGSNRKLGIRLGNLFLLQTPESGPSTAFEEDCAPTTEEKICKEECCKGSKSSAMARPMTSTYLCNQKWNLKWNKALQSMRAKSSIRELEVKIIIEGSSTAGHKEYLMGLLRTELEKVKEEKEGFEFKIAKFEKSSKDLDQLLASQITDKSKKGFGYNVVPSPHPLILNRPTPLDLSYSGLEEFKQPEVNEYGPRDSSVKPTTGCDKESDNSKENTDDSLKQQQKTDSSSVKSPLKVDKDWKEKFFCPANQVREEEPKKARENNDAPIIEDWVSDDEDDVEPIPKVEKKTVIPTATKKEFVKPEKPVRRSVRYAEMYRSQRPRGNQRNWNGQKSNQLGCNFVFNNKACFICGSFDHIQYSCPNVHKHMVPRAVLMKTGLKTVNTVRSVNTVRPFSTARSFNTVRPSYTAHPKSTVHCARPRTYFQNQAQSTVQRPLYKRTALTKRSYNQNVNTGRQNVNTVRARGFNAVKPSACWVWKPIKPNGASLSNSQLNDKGFVDSGCSRHIEYHVPSPNESPLHAVHSHGSDEDDEFVVDVVHGYAEERQPEDSTAGIIISTAPINISTARETHSTAGRVVYGRRSKEARTRRLGLKMLSDYRTFDEEERAQRATKDQASTAKKQKVEHDDEKEELKNYLDIVPREDVAVNVESLSIKTDVVELYRLVKERYSSSKPEGYDLMLWGDLHTLLEPDEESEIWMNQNEYNLIKKTRIIYCQETDIKEGEYDIWAMKMEHYSAHTNYPIWEVIQYGNGLVSITTDTQGQIKVLPPRTAEEILARERERKARTTLLMALPEDHLAKFHKMTDAKEMWDAIKSRFGGNDESKKMQKYILKQQFEGFSVSNSEGLHKGYDRFQSLLSQLEIHGAGVSTEDANQKFLRSLPSAWSQVSLIMRTKPGVDSLSFDDLYNNLRVFENDVKGSTASSSSTQNVAFVSENTSSTNDVSTAYGVSNPSGHNSQEMDLKWPGGHDFDEMKKFTKRTVESYNFDAKEPVLILTKFECYNCHKTDHFARECKTKGNQDSRMRDAWNSSNKDGRRSGKQEGSKALVTLMERCRFGPVTQMKNMIMYIDSLQQPQAQTQRITSREQLSDASIEIKAYNPRLMQSVPTNAAMKVNIVKPIVNRVRPANCCWGGKKGNAVKPLYRLLIGDKKDITGKISPNTIVDQDYPHRALKHKGIIDSGCQHMLEKRPFL